MYPFIEFKNGLADPGVACGYKMVNKSDLVLIAIDDQDRVYATPLGCVKTYQPN